MEPGGKEVNSKKAKDVREQRTRDSLHPDAENSSAKEPRDKITSSLCESTESGNVGTANVVKCKTQSDDVAMATASATNTLQDTSDSSKKKRKKRKKKVASSTSDTSTTDTSSTKVDGVSGEALGCSAAHSPNTHLPTKNGNFDRELDWCIAQLQIGMSRSDASKSQRSQNEKYVHILRSERTALPRKRQLMKNLFGDYRSRMMREPVSRRYTPSDLVPSIKQVGNKESVESMGKFYRRSAHKVSSVGKVASDSSGGRCSGEHVMGLRTGCTDSEVSAASTFSFNFQVEP